MGLKKKGNILIQHNHHYRKKKKKNIKSGRATYIIIYFNVGIHSAVEDI